MRALSPVPLSAVTRMTIYDEQVTTMRVRWEKALGATGYMLLYSTINATQPARELEVRPTTGLHTHQQAHMHMHRRTYRRCVCVCAQAHTCAHTHTHL